MTLLTRTGEDRASQCCDNSIRPNVGALREMDNASKGKFISTLRPNADSLKRMSLVEKFQKMRLSPLEGNLLMTLTMTKKGSDGSFTYRDWQGDVSGSGSGYMTQ